MWDKFSKDAKNVIVRAQEEAKRFRQKFLEPEHILLAVTHTPECMALKILERMGVNLGALAKLVERGQTAGEPGGEFAVQFSLRSREVFELAYEELRRIDDENIGSEHLLLGIYKERGDGSRILRSQGVYLGELRASLRAFEDESQWAGSQEAGNIPSSPAEHVGSEKSRESESSEYVGRQIAKQLIWKILTDEAVSVLVRAQQEARRLGQRYVEPDHLLLAIAQTAGCAGHGLLKQAGLDPAALAALIEKEQGAPSAASMGVPALSPLTEYVLRLAREEAVRLAKFHVGSEHLLLGISRQRDIAPRVLRSQGVLPDNIVGYIRGQV